MVAYFENMIRHNEYVTKDYEHQESQIRLTEKNNRKENVKKHRAKRYTKK
ncbi:hypothetical protein HOG21_02625 [bacterium]|nr:hypothetical protein [bacterium]